MNYQSYMKSTLATVFVISLIISAVGTPLVAGAGFTLAQADDHEDGDKEGTIVGGDKAIDGAVQHPAQFNQQGDPPVDAVYETNSIPPVDGAYHDTAKGEIDSFTTVRKTDSSTKFSNNADGHISLGFSVENVPSTPEYTLGLNYDIPSDVTVFVTPVNSEGEAIDKTYKLTGGETASNIPLSNTEADYVRNTGEMRFVVTSCSAGKPVSFSEMTLVSSQEQKAGQEDYEKNYQARDGLSRSEMGCDTGPGSGPIDIGIDIKDTDEDGTFETGETLTFTGLADHPEGEAMDYSWSSAFYKNGKKVTNSFAEPGEYTAVLSVTDGEVTKTAERTFQVKCSEDFFYPQTCKDRLGEPPEASIKVTDANGNGVNEIGETLTFDASATTDPDNDIKEYVFTSTSFNPPKTATDGTATHVYNNKGTYTVSVKVMDEAGNTDTASTTFSVGAAPEADFNVIDNGDGDGRIEIGEPVKFDGGPSSPPFGGTITDYTWSDALNAQGETTETTFSSTGQKTVTLTVTGDNGLTDTRTKDVFVYTDQGPTAQIDISDSNGDGVLKVGETITLDGTASQASEGDTLVRHAWNGDIADRSTPVEAQKTSVVFDSAGKKTIELVVEEQDGDTDTATTTITIVKKNPTDYAPIADLEITGANNDGVLTVGETVTVDASDSRATGDESLETPHEFNGDLGAKGSSYDAVKFDTTFSSTGTKTITVTVTDNDQSNPETATATRTVKVYSDPTPTAKLSYEVQNGDNDGTVETDETLLITSADSSIPSPGVIEKRNWNGQFGTSTPTQETVEFVTTYRSPGDKTVTVQVVDDTGDTDTAQVTIPVEKDNDGGGGDDPTPTGTLEVTDQGDGDGKFETGEQLQIDANPQVEDPDTIEKVVWQGDTPGSGESSPNGVTTVNYDIIGSKTIKAVVHDDDSPSDTKTLTKTITIYDGSTDPIPEGNIVITDAGDKDGRLEVGEQIKFNANARVDSPDSIESVEWSQATSGSGEIIKQSFGSKGLYTAEVTISDDDSPADTITLKQDFRIRTDDGGGGEEPDPEPTTNIVVTGSNGDGILTPGEEINFDANPSVDSPDSIESVEWNGAASGQGATTSETYGETGEYTVKVTVHDDDTPADTATDTATFTIQEPQNQGCEPREASLKSITVSPAPSTPPNYKGDTFASGYAAEMATSIAGCEERNVNYEWTIQGVSGTPTGSKTAATWSTSSTTPESRSIKVTAKNTQGEVVATKKTTANVVDCQPQIENLETRPSEPQAGYTSGTSVTISADVTMKGPDGVCAMSSYSFTGDGDGDGSLDATKSSTQRQSVSNVPDLSLTLTRETSNDNPVRVAQLTVTSNTGDSDTATETMRLGGNAKPSVEISASSSDGTPYLEGEPVTLTANAQDDGEIASYTWTIETTSGTITKTGRQITNVWQGLPESVNQKVMSISVTVEDNGIPYTQSVETSVQKTASDSTDITISKQELGDSPPRIKSWSVSRTSVQQFSNTFEISVTVSDVDGDQVRIHTNSYVIGDSPDSPSATNPPKEDGPTVAQSGQSMVVRPGYGDVNGDTYTFSVTKPSEADGNPVWHGGVAHFNVRVFDADDNMRQAGPKESEVIPSVDNGPELTLGSLSISQIQGSESLGWTVTVYHPDYGCGAKNDVPRGISWGDGSSQTVNICQNEGNLNSGGNAPEGNDMYTHVYHKPGTYTVSYEGGTLTVDIGEDGLENGDCDQAGGDVDGDGICDSEDTCIEHPDDADPYCEANEYTEYSWIDYQTTTTTSQERPDMGPVPSSAVRVGSWDKIDVVEQSVVSSGPVQTKIARAEGEHETYQNLYDDRRGWYSQAENRGNSEYVDWWFVEKKEEQSTLTRESATSPGSGWTQGEVVRTESRTTTDTFENPQSGKGSANVIERTETHREYTVVSQRRQTDTRWFSSEQSGPDYTLLKKAENTQDQYKLRVVYQERQTRTEWFENKKDGSDYTLLQTDENTQDQYKLRVVYQERQTETQTFESKQSGRDIIKLVEKLQETTKEIEYEIKTDTADYKTEWYDSQKSGSKYDQIYSDTDCTRELVDDADYDKDYKIEYKDGTTTHSSWFDEPDGHSGTVVETRVEERGPYGNPIDFEHKIEWETTDYDTEWYDDKSDQSGDVVDTRKTKVDDAEYDEDCDTDYKYEVRTDSADSYTSWFPEGTDPSNQLPSSTYVEIDKTGDTRTSVSDTDYKYKVLTQERQASTEWFNTDEPPIPDDNYVSYTQVDSRTIVTDRDYKYRVVEQEGSVQTEWFNTDEPPIPDDNYVSYTQVDSRTIVTGYDYKYRVVTQHRQAHTQYYPEHPSNLLPENTYVDIQATGNSKEVVVDKDYQYTWTEQVDIYEWTKQTTRDVWVWKKQRVQTATTYEWEIEYGERQYTASPPDSSETWQFNAESGDRFRSYYTENVESCEIPTGHTYEQQCGN